MTTEAVAAPSWSTASFGDTADSSPIELSALGQHLDMCKGSGGRLFALQCGAEKMNGFISSHFVTTVVAAGFLIGAGTLML